VARVVCGAFVLLLLLLLLLLHASFWLDLQEHVAVKQ
jgi:hypothetical protein